MKSLNFLEFFFASPQQRRSRFFVSHAERLERTINHDVNQKIPVTLVSWKHGYITAAVCVPGKCAPIHFPAAHSAIVSKKSLRQVFVHDRAKIQRPSARSHPRATAHGIGGAAWMGRVGPRGADPVFPLRSKHQVQPHVLAKNPVGPREG